MPCAFPIPARRADDGGRPVIGGEARVFKQARRLGVSELADEVLSNRFLLFLPCGSCVGCQLSRARSWAIRCGLELQLHPSASFVTLTYEDKYLPPTLRRSDLSAWIKRLRSRVERPFRFFACGEYGEQRGRPHYHALLFGASVEEVMFHRSAWRFGFVTADAVNPARISYVAGYCAKKVGMFEEADERVDYSTGEVYRHQPPFLQMSRRPGIGGESRRHWRSWRKSAVWSGAEVPVPRYLHASWKENASESELARLELEKLESRMVPTVRELDASDDIASARVRLTSERRKL